MSFLEHLEELRWAIIRCICAVLLCAIPAGFYWKEIFHFIAVVPLKYAEPMPQLIFTAPAESVMFSIKITLTSAFISAVPYILWEVWRFIAPALYKKEKLLLLSIVIASTICFAGGFAFCYFILPMVLQFLTSFAVGLFEPYFKIDEYLSFLITMCIAFGIAFELPVLTFVLSKLGVIDYQFLIKHFRILIVAIFIIAAILTPPDVFSQILLALPLLFLYAISILIAFCFSQRAQGTQ